jgi:pantoate--beta-alanine ligase
MSATVPGPVVATDRAALAAVLGPVRAAGRSVALVPTMGALHDAHRVLVERAAALADVVVVSVFVNPLQFGPAEDFERYPRTLDEDVLLCARAGASVVFAPSVAQMYPAGEPQVRVSAGPMGDVLEGAARPGHFDGVLTVVAKLFGLVRPDVAVFGRKDAQQVALVQRMVADLDLPVRLDVVATVREDDGLAMSSRNRYLDAPARRAATALARAVAAGTASASGGVDAVVGAARAVLDAEPGVDTDYVALVDPRTFDPRDVRDAGLLVVAARVGGTRLIDNADVVGVGAAVTAPTADAAGADADRGVRSVTPSRAGGAA